MKRTFTALFSLPCFVLVLTGTGCKEPVDPPTPPNIVPCFTVVEDTFRDPREPVQFQNCSQKSTSYIWDFGDGHYSTEAEPSHTYASVGYFDVRLTAANKDYEKDIVQRIRVDYPRFKKIRVVQLPVLNRYGVPYDLDGSGLDLLYEITKDADHFGFGGDVSNVVLPYEFVILQDRSIDAFVWTLQLSCIGTGTQDTITWVSRLYEELIDSPVEILAWDSNRVEIVMEGVQ